MKSPSGRLPLHPGGESACRWRILEDRDGCLWVATNEGGLDRFDRRTNRFQHFRSRSDDPASLSDNNVQILSEDPRGNIWAGTLEEDGLQSNQFFWGAAFRSARGELFFGGINGFNRFFPGRIRENPVPPRIALTGFRIFNVPVVLPLDISVTPEIELTHDLRNPLTAVLGYADMVLKMIADNRFQPAQGMRYLEKISEACEKMNALLTSFLDIAAIETGSLTVVMHPENPVRLLNESADFHRRQAERKGIRFSADIPGDLPDLVTDRLRFSQVLDNLLSNAVKYTPPGGEILLRAALDDLRLVVSVRDTGPGLTEDDLSRMFQPYVRLSAMPTGGESSTGLGLSIVKRIVERHQGEVFVTSRPGEGSTFGFRLPLNADPDIDRATSHDR